MSESTRVFHSDSVTQSGFDDTLPCSEDTSLPPDVYELQSAYARIIDEETFEDDTQHSTNYDKDGTSEHRLSCHKKPDTFRKSPVDRPNVKTKLDDPSTLFSLNAVTSKLLVDGRNVEDARQRSRHASENTTDTKARKHMGVGNKIRSSEHVKPSLSKSESYGTSEKGEPWHTLSRSTPVPSSETNKHLPRRMNTDGVRKGDEKGIALKHQDTYLTSKQTETEIAVQNRRNDRKFRTVPFSTELDETSIATDQKNLSDHGLRTTSLTRCETTPVKLPSISNEVKLEVQKRVADITSSSDTYVSVCSKCMEKKCEKHTPANSYCLQCANYLCDRCLRHHGRIKSKKDHRVMKGNKMPGSFTVKFEFEGNLNEKCRLHTNRNIKCFCLDHNSLCCTVCKSTNHAACRLQPLDDFLIHTPDILKLKHEVIKASTLKLNSLRKRRHVLKSNAECSDKEKDSIIEEVKNKSLQMIEHIKKLEEKFISHVGKTFEEEKFELDRDIEECEKYIDISIKNIQYLDEPKGKQVSKLKTVEKVKQIEMMKLPEHLQNNLEKFETGNRVSHEFKVNEELFSRGTEMESFGELVPRVPDQLNLSKTTDIENSSCTAEDDLMEKPTGKYVTEYHPFLGWSEDDIRTSTCFTAIELLDDGSILVSDLKNLKLKWFDSDISLLQSTDVSSEPWGISKLCGNNYVVTLPMESSYQEVFINGGNLKLCRKIYVGIECTCVLQTEKQLLFAGVHVDEPKLILTDLDGKTKQSVLTEEKLNLFKRPNHLLKSLSDPKIVFLSDVDKGVFAIDIEKKDILFHYTQRTLRCTMGMAMTANGHIFICSQQTNSLHCITEEGEYMFSVSMDTIQDFRKPQCICYLPHLDEFLVTSDNNYSIVRFKLE